MNINNMNPEEEAIRIEMIKGERLVSLYKNSIALRQFGLPKSTSFIQELLDYEYVKGKKLSENSEATYAAFCIIEGLIRDSEIDLGSSDYPNQPPSFRSFLIMNTLKEKSSLKTVKLLTPHSVLLKD
jgi:hypothetical protein